MIKHHQIEAFPDHFTIHITPEKGKAFDPAKGETADVELIGYRVQYIEGAEPHATYATIKLAPNRYMAVFPVFLCAGKDVPLVKRAMATDSVIP